MAEPFISPFGLTITPALSCNKLSLQAASARAEVTYLKVEENTVLPPPRLALTDDDDRHGYNTISISHNHNHTDTRTLLPQLRLSLLHGCNNHVTNTSIGKTVQTSTGAVRFDKVERLRAAVVGAIEDGSRGETQGHTELVARGTTD